MSPASAADRGVSQALQSCWHEQPHLFVEQPVDVPQVGDVIAKDRAHLRTTRQSGERRAARGEPVAAYLEDSEHGRGYGAEVLRHSLHG